MQAPSTSIACVSLTALLAVATAVTGCGTSANSEIAAITRDSRHVTPRIVLHRAQSRLEEPMRRTVGSEAEWRDFLRTSLSERAEQVEATPDFQSSFVAVAAMGRRPTGGFNVAIPDAYVRRDSMFILVRHTIPGKNCIVPQAQTSPLAAVSLPRVADEIRFVVEERTLSCD